MKSGSWLKLSQQCQKVLHSFNTISEFILPNYDVIGIKQKIPCSSGSISEDEQFTFQFRNLNLNYNRNVTSDKLTITSSNENSKCNWCININLSQNRLTCLKQKYNQYIFQCQKYATKVLNGRHISLAHVSGILVHSYSWQTTYSVECNYIYLL